MYNNNTEPFIVDFTRQQILQHRINLLILTHADLRTIFPKSIHHIYPRVYHPCTNTAIASIRRSQFNHIYPHPI
jgi:hypothetical protein